MSANLINELIGKRAIEFTFSSSVFAKVLGYVVSKVIYVSYRILYTKLYKKKRKNVKPR